MNFLFTVSPLPGAAAAPRCGAILAAPASSVAALLSPPAGARVPGPPAHKARALAQLTAHRAQVLAWRRSAVPSSAKRW